MMLTYMVFEPAFATSYDNKGDLVAVFGREIINNVDISREQNQKYPCRFSAKLNLETGRLGNIFFVHPTTDPQMKLDVLDAVLSTATVSVPSQFSEDGFVEFEMGFGKYNGSNIQYDFERFKRTVEPKYGYSVFHAIPLEVLLRYPNVFTYEELVQSGHQRFLKNKCISAEKVEQLRKPWLDYFDQHSNATKEDILKFEKKIDSQFKQLLQAK